jgi:molybdopterin/thiamine biosynthesis adenylyltransferase
MTTETDGTSGTTRDPGRTDPPLTPRWRDGRSVKVIGLGGTGGIVARYAALYLASRNRPARLVLIDGDVFEARNAARMFFRSVGNKAAVKRDELLALLPDSSLTVLAVEEFLTPENIGRLIRSGDLVFLCVDNHPTRKLVSDHCGQLDDVALVSGGNDGVGPDSTGAVRSGTYGNCQIYLRSDGLDLTPSLSRYHPEIESPVGPAPGQPDCLEAVAATPQLLFANLTAATVMLNSFYLHLCDVLPYAEVVFDLAEGVMRPLALPVPGRE